MKPVEQRGAYAVGALLLLSLTGCVLGTGGPRPAPSSPAPEPSAALDLAGEWRSFEVGGSAPEGAAREIMIAVEPAASPSPGTAVLRASYGGCPAVWVTSYTLDQGRLMLGPAAPLPALGCLEPQSSGAGWLAGFLSNRPAVELADGILTLSGGPSTVRARRS
ncbi:hypothetical protein G7070_12375 [Propioniciclava coleopterorum]|uniref:META domain-containing protein n=1 Tax=Propioniciclava coleopterorum TaxID=2714937 RepID=A0A6G7Y7Z3_9ACTN|nr:hypothetical protein [Propioniciclava coleopterorum]QIK72913.1 hypothetical protein G7070_12375 [Propioniciclava coleopterorum]